MLCFSGDLEIPNPPLQVFDLMDRDKGGSLGIEELKQLMEVSANGCWL